MQLELEKPRPQAYIDLAITASNVETIVIEHLVNFVKDASQGPTQNQIKAEDIRVLEKRVFGGGRVYLVLGLEPQQTEDDDIKAEIKKLNEGLHETTNDSSGAIEISSESTPVNLSIRNIHVKKKIKEHSSNDLDTDLLETHKKTEPQRTQDSWGEDIIVAGSSLQELNAIHNSKSSGTTETLTQQLTSNWDTASPHTNAIDACSGPN